MNKYIYAIGLVALCYYVAEKGYNAGVKQSLKAFKKYALEHPDETFKEFLESNEEV